MVVDDVAAAREKLEAQVPRDVGGDFFGCARRFTVHFEQRSMKKNAL